MSDENVSTQRYEVPHRRAFVGAFAGCFLVAAALLATATVSVGAARSDIDHSAELLVGNSVGDFSGLNTSQGVVHSVRYAEICLEGVSYHWEGDLSLSAGVGGVPQLGGQIEDLKSVGSGRCGFPEDYEQLFAHVADEGGRCGSSQSV